VPDQGAELTDVRRGDPGLRQQVRAQQLRQDRRVDLVFSELRNAGLKVWIPLQVREAARILKATLEWR
jgi:hypothetical protein